MQNELLQIKDLVVGIAAFTGMGMSFYNLRREHNKEKVKLVVTPKSIKSWGKTQTGQEFSVSTKCSFHGKASRNLFVIEVINLSHFDITVDEVGFLYSRRTDRAVITCPTLFDNKPFPRKLEPRESVSVYFQISDLMQGSDVHLYKYAYAETACGEVRKGTSEALKGLSAFAKKLI
ncbi:hypothetical protein PD716_08605 [Vibrio gigantis]|uniref:hypothetical protein n=1 Tax=Vibrio TaxID=662 RepID=UPI000C842CE2|nr:hypothetical protein [Vibrio lentus]PME66093.1 hypothetical protein BCV33_01965 [Vibrio lentus]PMG61459.1 hypothetical protein BCU87_14220 [Vibrio lentus]PMN01897.1 hypothetical protein BCT40_22995 [Vibrio lentus]TKF58565.1 hypothetical protein FCV63_07610 [Vibrio lentus]